MCLRNNILNLNSLRSTDCCQTDLSLCPGSSSELCVNLGRSLLLLNLNFLICKLRLITALNSQGNCKIKVNIVCEMPAQCLTNMRNCIYMLFTQIQKRLKERE